MLYFQQVSAPTPEGSKDELPVQATEAVVVEPAPPKRDYTRYYVIAGCIAAVGLVAFIAIDIMFFGTVHQNTATEWTNQKLADKDVRQHLITAIPRWIGRLLTKH